MADVSDLHETEAELEAATASLEQVVERLRTHPEATAETAELAETAVTLASQVSALVARFLRESGL